MNTSVDSGTQAQILERMKKRTEEIAQRAEVRRQEKQGQAAMSENADYFQETFQNMKDDIERKIDDAGNIKKAQLLDYFDELVKDVQQMQEFLNESSMFLASFQVKKAQEHIKTLNNLVHSKIDELQPKKKFGFGRKKTGGEKSTKAKELKKNDGVDGCSKEKNTLDEIIEKQFFGFKDQSNQTLTKSAEELDNRQLNIHNLDNCKVIALGNPSTLQIASLRNCTVIVGPTSRSAFIKDCINCKFMIACQQLRIHNTKNTQFYLHVTGAAIIENCHDVQFAPYTIKYPELKEHYCKSGLDLKTNYWDKIEDFHWLNENENSPNWSVIPEKERIDNWLK